MKPFIVAELSCNHLGSLDRALAIAEAAVKAGASALKLQTWKADTMAIPGYVIQSGPWKGRDLNELYREAYTPWEWHKPIFARCKELGIECFSTPFDKESVDFLETLSCLRYKISSFELVDLPLIRYVAKLGKPMIMSTGMATRGDISRACIAAGGCREITLLKCTSGYPAHEEEANLREMVEYQRFGAIHFGISDHTSGIGVAVAAVALGATVVEKHLTLSRSNGGPDARFSLEPHEFEQLVIECNRAAQAIGYRYEPLNWGPTESEKSQVALRRSLYFSHDLKLGAVITEDCVRTARPALGLMPCHLPSVVGRTLTRNVQAGEPVLWEVIKP